MRNEHKQVSVSHKFQAGDSVGGQAHHTLGTLKRVLITKAGGEKSPLSSKL